MKKTLIYIMLFFTATCFSGCEEPNEAEGKPSPIINVDNVRRLHKGEDIKLDDVNLQGATKIVGLVISDYQNGNLPEGMLVLQSARIARIRGINLNIGAAAATYLPGDSIVVNISGATLSKVNGSLQINGLSNESIEKVSSGHTPAIQTVSVDILNRNPGFFESTLLRIYGCTFNRVFGEDYAGDKTFHDGGATTLELHTEVTASFASENLPKRANTTGIVFLRNAGETENAQVWPRSISEMVSTGVDVDPNIPLGKTPIVISGFLTDPTGTDGNYEYVQFMATQDIDFEMTPFSMVTCNNAGATGTNHPTDGWASGLTKTYKINLTSGTVAKGNYFYVGGIKKIWGANSTDISSANWVASVLYVDTDGADFGSKTGGLLANSGNPAGIALFLGTTVTEASVPIDVIFYGGTGGDIYSAGPPPKGYRITDTDRYLKKHATTGADQPFFRNGTNTFIFSGFPATSNFAKLGGVYNATTEKWTTVRAMTSTPIGSTSTVSVLETGTGNTKLE
jgi:hypothetical protein